MFLGVASYLKFTAAVHALRINRSFETQLKQHQGAVNILSRWKHLSTTETIVIFLSCPASSGRQVSVPYWSVLNYTSTLHFFNSWSSWRYVMLLSNSSDVNLGSWVTSQIEFDRKKGCFLNLPSWRENRSKNNPTRTKVDPKTLHGRWTLLVMYSWPKRRIDSGSSYCFVMYILAFSICVIWSYCMTA